ncbi:MAG TPA: hypothetical protein ENI33_07305 [Thermoplasmatales archaeon]|nr:hypothetical protein [Thermoplasmatales archaeon]
MKMMADTRGRIPFALLGIFLVIGSAIVSGIITTLEKERIKDISYMLKQDSVTYLIKYAEIDMARILSYSFLKAFQKVGELPVIYSNLPTPASRDYADFNENGIYDRGDPDIIDEYDEIIKFNQNWARNMARKYFNDYLNVTFKNNLYRNTYYSINIFDPENNGAVNDWRDIKLYTVDMKLKREDEIDLLVSEKSETYPVYWKAFIDNFKIEICNLSSGEKWIKKINISCLIPSRLPLLIELIETYQDSINGISPLMGVFTVIGEGYTEIRTLLQYANKYDWVANIVDNRWLQYLTNLCLILIEYMVFNSVDPLSLAHLAINMNDLISKSNITAKDKYVTENMDEVISDFLINYIPFQPFSYDNFFRTVGKQNETIAREIVTNLQNEVNSSIVERSGNVSVAETARNILEKSETLYYYINDKGELRAEKEFKGYSFDGYRLTTKNGDPTEKNIEGDVYTKIWLSEINETVLNEIVDRVYETYKSSFETKVKRKIVKEFYSNLINTAQWRFKSGNSWDLTQSKPLQSFINKDEIPSSLPYYENWSLNWKRNETWEHYEIVRIENNTPIYEWVEYNVNHWVKENVTFIIYAHNYPDVKNVFHEKIFNSSSQKVCKDDNLEHLLRSYINSKFIPYRNTLIDISLDIGKGEEGIYNQVTWKNNTALNDTKGYNISWLIGENGEVVKALKEIVKLIGNDKDIYSNISYFSSNKKIVSTIDDIERERILLLKKFRENRERYINREYYMEGGKYKSAGAKVIAEMREWFVNEIEKCLNKSIKDELENIVNKELKKYDADFEYKDYERNKIKYEGNISKINSVHFGREMKLIKPHEWEENVTIAINSNPHYFGAVGENLMGEKYEDIAREENWYFNIKNICIFGPTGLPVLPPTPATPWIATLNLWYIHVEGSWGVFKIVDSNDETVPDAFFGHTGQIYCRKSAIVEDKVCYGEEIGRCKCLEFGFDTMSVGIVPSGKLPIGDLSPVDMAGSPIIEENSVGGKEG